MTRTPFRHADELPHEPFERRRVGSHGAFLLRINVQHVARARVAIGQRRLDEVEVEFLPPVETVKKIVRIA